MSALLQLCFTLSGAAALALEMLWMRSAGLVLGQTAATTAVVLAVYFAGIGLGAALGRRVRARPVRAYGLLELGAAAGAVWSLGVFRLLGEDRVQGWLAAAGPAGGFAAVSLAMLPATLCLGATLPALGQALAPPGTAGRRGGLLYALNTLGGAAGIAAAGFGLPAAIGVSASYAAAAASSALAGGIALAIGNRLTAPIPAPPAGVPAQGITAQPRLSRARLRAVAAGAGALGLALEVLWTKLFAQVLHNSVYSFSAIALVFLLALAAGAAVAALLLRRVEPASIAGAALLLAAVSTAGGVWLFLRRTDGLAYMGMQSGLGEYMLRIVALAAMTVGPGAFASGMVLPALWGAWGGRDDTARPLGDLSAANMLGGIAGAAAAGFLAIPLLGMRGSLIAAAVSYVVLADVAVPARGWLRPVGYAALLAVVLVDPLRAPIVHLRSGAEKLRAITEGPSGIVTTVETEGDLQLRLDNYYVLGGTAAAAGERRLGLLPLLLHPAPHHVAFVGLATGITASAGPALGVEATTVVELVPEVAAAAREHFGGWNGRLLDRPDVRVVLGDGRRYLAASREQFDVIASDLFIPWHAGTGNLYSREMYQTVARRLAPGGLFCQWLPLYQLTREELAVIARTFLDVFPQVSLWRGDFYPNRPVLGLVGRCSCTPLDLDRIGERIRALPAWARDPLLTAPRGFVMLYAGDLTAAADLFEGAPRNTDDRPVIEFTAPRLTRIGASGDKDWFTGRALAEFYESLDRRLAEVSDPLLPATAEVRAARRAGTALFRCAVAMAEGNSNEAARLQSEVRSLVPEVVAAGESPGSAEPGNADPKLRDLWNEQEAMRRQVDALERRLDEALEGKKKP